MLTASANAKNGIISVPHVARSSFPDASHDGDEFSLTHSGMSPQRMLFHRFLFMIRVFYLIIRFLCFISTLKSCSAIMRLNLLRACISELTAVGSGARADFDSPVGGGDQFGVVFDDQHRVTGGD